MKLFTQVLMTKDRITLNNRGVFTMSINGDERHYVIVNESCDNINSSIFFEDNVLGWTTKLEEIRLVKLPTAEETAAYLSVEKAKEALKAAENALKAVKDKK